MAHGSPVTDYAATCRLCLQTILTVETLRPEDIEVLAEHLKATHPLDVVGIRIWREQNVMQFYKLTTV